MVTLNHYRRALQYHDSPLLSNSVVTIVAEMRAAAGAIWNEAQQQGKDAQWVNTHPVLVLYVEALRKICVEPTVAAAIGPYAAENRSMYVDEWNDCYDASVLLAYNYCRDTVAKGETNA